MCDNLPTDCILHDIKATRSADKELRVGSQLLLNIDTTLSISGVIQCYRTTASGIVPGGAKKLNYWTRKAGPKKLHELFLLSQSLYQFPKNP